MNTESTPGEAELDSMTNSKASENLFDILPDGLALAAGSPEVFR